MLDWLRFCRNRLIPAGEKARREHERWLDHALSGRLGVLPRIPTRRVRDGGFGPFTRSSAGRRWADGWWGEAIERTPEGD